MTKNRLEISFSMLDEFDVVVNDVFLKRKRYKIRELFF